MTPKVKRKKCDSSMGSKRNQKLKNPFVYEGYKGEEYFCDRIVETEKFISQLENGCNLTLVSPRKIGKTGLIKHAFKQIKQKKTDAVCIYTDIFHTHNQYELAQALGKAIIQEKMLDSRSTMAKILNTFSTWRPVLSFDPIRDRSQSLPSSAVLTTTTTLWLMQRPAPG